MAKFVRQLVSFILPVTVLIIIPILIEDNISVHSVSTLIAGLLLAVPGLSVLIWALLFFIINTLYFVIYEEPDLEKKFGIEYRLYKKHVSRWIPKLRSYQEKHG